MKKFLSLLFLFLVIFGASAQDVIVKKDGTTVLCKVIHVTPSEVVYLLWSDLKGPQYIMDGSLVANINYQNGRHDQLNEPTTNSYAPGIQQTGNSQYNDNALLAIDRARGFDSNWYDKYKRYKTAGWSVIGAGVGVGLGIVIVGIANLEYPGWIYVGCGTFLGVGSLVTGSVLLIKANNLKKHNLQLSSAPVLHHDFNFDDGSSLSMGLDVIHNKQMHCLTPSLGFQFNF